MSNCAEVIIIGGGVIGCATAYYLAKAGTSVIVLEGSDHIGNGGSSRNGGGVRQSGRDPRELPLAMYGIRNLWPHLSEELETDCEYHQDGNLRLGDQFECRRDVLQLEKHSCESGNSRTAACGNRRMEPEGGPDLPLELVSGPLAAVERASRCIFQYDCKRAALSSGKSEIRRRVYRI